MISGVPALKHLNLLDFAMTEEFSLWGPRIETFEFVRFRCLIGFHAAGDFIRARGERFGDGLAGEDVKGVLVFKICFC